MEKERLPLREWRTRRLLSQAELAGMVGVNYNTIRRLEHGDSVPQMRTLRKLCEALGIGPDQIIFEPKPKAQLGLFEDTDEIGRAA